MSEEGPLRFYCISIGRYDDYHESFVLATSPDDAAKRAMRSNWRRHNEAAWVSEGDFNEHGVLRRGNDIYAVELPGPDGYLWDSETLRKYYADRIVCRLCGDTPGTGEEALFLNADRKCELCSKLKKIEL